MKIELNRHTVHGPLARKVERISGQKLFACYQCGNCTAGCPVGFAMDAGPQQLIRWVLLGMEDEALSATSFWRCAACQQCTSRCPKGIDIARVMEALRVIVLRAPGGADRVRLPDIPAADLDRLPPMALIGGFRKLTG
jgi:heterodisulfide reductase subunit C